MAIDGYSLQLSASLLDGTTTSIADESSEYSGSLTEHFYTMISLAAGASASNYKLGGLTNPKFLKVKGADGVSFTISSGGDALEANEWALLEDRDSGLGISEIWLSNSSAQQQSVLVLAAE